MRSEILNLLREKSPQPVSGQDLANHFGITRTAVWKHIQSLKKMGYGIEAYTKKGYVLVSVPNKLLPEEISRHLHTRFIGRNMAYEDVIPSTNDLLKKMALQGKITPARIGPGPGQSLWHYKNGGLETYPEPQENGLWNRGLYQKGLCSRERSE